MSTEDLDTAQARPVGPGSDHALRRKIIVAARECFARQGVRRTTMEDVAATAGLSRATMYRFVPSRTDVIEAVIMERLTELAEGWRAVLTRHRRFDRAVVEVSVAIIDAVRNDPELQALFERTTSTRLIRLLAGPQPRVRGYVVEFFRGFLDRSRASGALRADVSYERLAEWICGVYLTLILREDLDARGERAFIRDFLLPSLRSTPG